MKLQISRGSTNFTLEFEDHELQNVAKNIGTIMTNSLGATQLEIFEEPINSRVFETEEAFRESKELESVGKTDNEINKIVVEAEQKRLKDQAERDRLEQEEAKRAEAELLKKEKEEEAERIKQKREEERTICLNAIALAEKIQLKANNEDDLEVKEIFTAKAFSAKNEAERLSNLFSQNWGELIVKQEASESKEESQDAEVTKPEPVCENETKTEQAPAVEETKNESDKAEEPKVKENADTYKKGAELIINADKGKLKTDALIRKLMELFPGTKAEKLMSAMRTFPQKEALWTLIQAQKGMMKNLLGMSQQDIKEFGILVSVK